MTDTWYTRSLVLLDVGTLEKDMKKTMMHLKYQLHEEGDGEFYVENDNEVTLELCFRTRIVYDYFPPVILNTLN